MVLGGGCVIEFEPTLPIDTLPSNKRGTGSCLDCLKALPRIRFYTMQIIYEFKQSKTDDALIFYVIC